MFYQDVDAETQFFDQPGTYELRAPAFFLNQVQGARGRACLNIVADVVAAVGWYQAWVGVIRVRGAWLSRDMLLTL